MGTRRPLRNLRKSTPTFRRLTCPVVASATFVLLVCTPMQLRAYPALHGGEQSPSLQAQDAPASRETQEGQLQQLISAQQSAMQSGEPAAILQTSQSLAALTLRLLAGVDIQLDDLGAASEAYRQSLALDDNPSVRLELAGSYLLRKDAAAALAEAAKITAAQPENAPAWRITGEALLQKHDSPGALQALTRSFDLSPEPHTAVLLAQAALREPDAKVRVFSQIAAKLGESPALHLLLASACHQADDLTGTIAELKQALALNPDLGPVHLALGNAYWELNEYQYNADSLREFSDAQRLEPADYYTNYDLGSIESQYHLFDKAEQHLQLAAKANPSSPDPWIVLGMNAYSESDSAGARSCLDKAVILSGKQESHEDYGIQRAYLVLSRLATEAGQTDSAAELFARAESVREGMLKSGISSALSESTGLIVSNSPGAARQISSEQRKQQISAPSGTASPEQLSTARKQLQALAANSLNDAGTALARTHDYPTALLRFRAAAKANPELSPVMRNLGLAAFHTGGYQESIDALTRALQQNPDDTLSRGYLGMSLFSLYRFREAVTVFGALQTALFSNPAFATTDALALLRSHEPEEAKSVLAQVVANAPSPAAQVAAADAYLELDDSEAATALSKSALQTDPGVAGAHAVLGRVLLQQQQAGQAVAEFQAELKAAPGNAPARPDTQLLLASALSADGKRTQAQSLLASIRTAHPEYAAERQKVGEALLQAGAAKPALQALEGAELLNPQLPGIRADLAAVRRTMSTTTVTKQHPSVPANPAIRQ